MAEMSLINTPEWAAVIKRLVRAEMVVHEVTYEELSNRLQTQFGTVQTVSNLKAKINKGVLGAQLFVQILIVLETESLDIPRIRRMYEEITKND